MRGWLRLHQYRSRLRTDLSLVNRKILTNSGLTVPGGIVDWQLVITNTSNVSVTNLLVMDILPWVGDTGVIDPQAGYSDWRPNLQVAVTGPIACH